MKAKASGMEGFELAAVVLALVIGLAAGGCGAGAPRIDSIAVLPIENLSRDPAQEYFAQGITANLIDHLGRTGTVRVISFNSMEQYRRAPKPLPEIARELNVQAVVEAGVQRQADRVRIFTKLLHVPDGRQLWEQTFDRDSRDIIIMAADISRAVLRELKAKVPPQQDARLAARPVNPQAMDAFLRARFGGEPSKADLYLKQALELDPGFAFSHFMVAYNYINSGLAPKDIYPKAKAAAEKAASLDQALSIPHVILAHVVVVYEYDFTAGERYFRRAVDLNPNTAEAHHGYAHLLLSMGRTEEAKEETMRALEIDPINAGLIACVGWHDVTLGKYEEAEKHSRQAINMGAAGPFPHKVLGWSYEQRNLFDKAIPEFQEAVAVSREAVHPKACLAHAYAAAGKEPEARAILSSLLERRKKEYVSAYEIAAVYAGLGDKEHSFEWLQKAYEERSESLPSFRMDPRIRGLQSDPRFQELLRRMNFPAKAL